jgi:hypothetical protein
MVNEARTSEASVERRSCRSVLVPFLSGWFLCPIVAAIILPLVFGLDRRDSASVWLFSGAMDLIMGLVLSPICMVAFGVLRGVQPRTEGAPGLRPRWILAIALAVFAVALVAAWALLLDGRAVVRAW